MDMKTQNAQVPEDIIHYYCVQWFNFKYGNSGAVLHHSPNENPKGTKTTLVRYNVKMQKLGRQAGFPDIMIVYKSSILFIEIKTRTGVLSSAQKSLFKKFSDTGFEVKVVRTLEEFQEIADHFFKIN